MTTTSFHAQDTAAQGEVLPLKLWLNAWRFWRRYHRYEVQGLENLQTGRAGLIVGYHGRPLALDMCILGVEVYERMGYLPHGIIHGYFEQNPALKWLIDGLQFVTGDSQALRDVIARGEHIVTVPGGTREGCRSFRHRYEVDWGKRTGYIRLALKYDLPIIPVACSGVDDTYIGLNDGYAWGKRLNVPYRLPAWVGLGPLGLWPFSPPFPVKMRQVIGEPIDLTADGPVDPTDRAALLALHQKVTGKVQALLELQNAAR